jgi:hypothetical protein
MQYTQNRLCALLFFTLMQYWREQHADLLPRVQFVAGSFFENVPTADVYFLRHIIHDWNDTAAVQVCGKNYLQGCRFSRVSSPLCPLHCWCNPVFADSENRTQRGASRQRAPRRRHRNAGGASFHPDDSGPADAGHSGWQGAKRGRMATRAQGRGVDMAKDGAPEGHDIDDCSDSRVIVALSAGLESKVDDGVVRYKLAMPPLAAPWFASSVFV